ncbi:MAG: hypothetical protein AAF725_27745, partial [Acidobacteriota bacterium]
AEFAPEVFVDPGDGGGELDFSFADVPPVAVIPDGVLVEVTYEVVCAPPPEIVPLPFSQAPPASFGDTSGASVPGLSTDGSFRLLDGLRGDCSGDGVVDAGDFTACGLELFDGDGDFWLDVVSGSFAGDPVGCDANADAVVDAGDVACKRRLAFAQPCVSQASGSGVPLLELPGELVVEAGQARGELIAVPGGRALSAVALTLAVDEAQIDPLSLAATAEAGGSIAATFAAGPGRVGLIVEGLAALRPGARVELVFETAPGFTGGVVRDALAVEEISFGSSEGASVEGAATSEEVTLLVDGFESGDLSRWSGSQP